MESGTAHEVGAMNLSNFEFRISNSTTVHLTEIRMSQTLKVESPHPPRPSGRDDRACRLSQCWDPRVLGKSIDWSQHCERGQPRGAPWGDGRGEIRESKEMRAGARHRRNRIVVRGRHICGGAWHRHEDRNARRVATCLRQASCQSPVRPRRRQASPVLSSCRGRTGLRGDSRDGGAARY